MTSREASLRQLIPSACASAVAAEPPLARAMLAAISPLPQLTRIAFCFRTVGCTGIQTFERKVEIAEMEERRYRKQLMSQPGATMSSAAPQL